MYSLFFLSHFCRGGYGGNLYLRGKRKRMKRVIVPLGGMSNVPDVNVSRDGDAQLLVNMHHSGGDVVQVTAPREAAIEGIKSIYKHAAADKVLGISEDGKTVYEINLTTGNKTALSLGEELSVLPIDEVRKRAGEKSIPAQGSNMRYFNEVGFASSYFGTGNGLLKLVGEVNTLNVLNFPGAEYQPWKDYTSSIQYVRVEGFTSIGANALSGCVNLQGVVIDDSVTSIGAYAFQNAGLKKIFIPPTVEAIDDNAFAGCSVEEVYILAPLPNLDRVFPNKPKLYVNYGTAHLFDDYANDGWEVEEMEMAALPSVVNTLSFMGNIVCLQCDDVILYIRWSGDRYKYLGPLPEPPGVRFDVELHTANVETKEEYFSTLADAEKYDNAWVYAKAGYYDAALDLLYADGDIVDSALYRIGLRLFDGSYIVSSLFFVNDNLQPYEAKDTSGNVITTIEVGKKNFHEMPKSTGTKAKYDVWVRGIRVEWILDEYDLTEWEDLISSVDVFCSGSIMHHKRMENISTPILPVENYGVHKSTGANPGVFWVVKEDDDYNKDLIDAMAMMYRVASYDLQGGLKIKVKDSSPSNIAVQERLANIISAHSYIGKSSLRYNARMHCGGAKEIIFKGYDDYAPRQSVEGVFSAIDGWTTLGEVAVIVTLNGVEGESRIVKSIEEFRVMRRAMEGGFGAFLQPILTYPDARATSIEFLVRRESVYYRLRFPLKRHDVLNMAYYLNTPKVIDESKGERLMSATYVARKLDSGNPRGSLSLVDLEKLKAKIYEAAKDELGLVDGKVIPPGKAEYTYIIDDGDGGEEIIFENETKKAISYTPSEWGLNDVPWSADSLILNVFITLKFRATSVTEYRAEVQEISMGADVAEDWDGVIPEEVRPIVNIPDTLYVSEVDNPWHFPNTYKFDGDIVAVASSAEEVSSGQFGQYPLYVFTTEGVWALGIDTSGKGAYVTQTPVSREVCTGQVCPVTGGVVFPTSRGIMIIQGSQVTNLSAVLDGSAEENSLAEQIAALAGIESITPTRFRTYIADCVIAYEYLHNEIIISNPKYKYSYVYSFNSGLWSVINKVYSKKTNSYPELLMYDEEKIYRFVDRAAPKAPVLYLTRPIKIDTTNHKRVIEAALRGTWEGKCFFYVLGSNDGVNWAVLGGKEHKETSKHRDLVAYCTRSKSYRYVAFAVASPSFSGRLSMIEMLVSEGMAQNKLV